MAFDDAVARFKSDPNMFAGIGLALSPDDDIQCIDLDRVIQRAEGKASIADADAERIVKQARAEGAWTEISPSGIGLHIWVRGQLSGSPSSKQTGHNGAVLEAFSSGRFIAVTGKQLGATGGVVYSQGLIDTTLDAIKRRGGNVTSAPPATDDDFFEEASVDGPSAKVTQRRMFSKTPTT